MGLYYTLFYGCIIKGVDDKAKLKLQEICRSFGWTLIPDGDIFIVDANGPRIDIDDFDAFRTDPANKCVAVYGPRGAGEAAGKRTEVAQSTYDALVQAFAGFDADFRWIRCEFYSGGPSSSYSIAVRWPAQDK